MRDKVKLIFITAIISIILTLSVTVTAQFITRANNITYSSNQTDKTNVKDSLDELYELSYEESISCSQNVTPPKIMGDLIAITISKNGTVRRADTSKEWYNYCDKRWANAVILLDKTKTYNVGDIIPEENIESYFVWIPKYKYKLWNVGTNDIYQGPHKIDIIFDTTNTTDIEGVSCATPLTSGANGNCNNGEFMTHPAFITMGVNGFWVGKFETGYKGAINAVGAQVSSSDSTKIIVKPNAYIWNKNSVYNFFVASYNYNRALNSHMMKNTEWGAVAYLSHSAFGINAEININNDYYLTGKSALLELDRLPYQGVAGSGDEYNRSYNTNLGYLASTTGNISGIYDMSGGQYEYMAAYIDGYYTTGGFTATTIGSYDAKYFDVYNASSGQTTYQYRILGDATGEVTPAKHITYSNNRVYDGAWYGDNAYFPDATNYPWHTRGGVSSYGEVSGIFDFNPFTGAASVSMSSRLVLSP